MFSVVLKKKELKELVEHILNLLGFKKLKRVIIIILYYLNGSP